MQSLQCPKAAGTKISQKAFAVEWQSLLFGNESWEFLLNTGICSIIMFMVILLGLRLLGKRGIHQLSVFELGVIIGLGSAAGDPMFYRDVGILPSIVVFIVVVLMYRLITYLVSKSERFETFVEGQPTYIMKDGIILRAFEDQPLAKEELFEQLRQHQVNHLGQVQCALMETDGQISIFYFPDDKVVSGLPILPEALDACFQTIPGTDRYACHGCGNTLELKPGNYKCLLCNQDKWVKAVNGPRVR